VGGGSIFGDSDDKVQKVLCFEQAAESVRRVIKADEGAVEDVIA